MRSLRNLTILEQRQIIESALDFKADLREDCSVRYIATNGIENINHEYYKAVRFGTLSSILIPIDAYICNVVGNMNYTEAYQKQ